MEGGRWKGPVVWKVDGGKELKAWKVERSCGMEGGWWKGAEGMEGGKEIYRYRYIRGV